MIFRWNRWNVEHIWRHGVRSEEAEDVVHGAKRPYPRHRDDDKWLVWGPAQNGRLLQVVFILDRADRCFVVHARPLTPKEKRRYRRETQQ